MFAKRSFYLTNETKTPSANGVIVLARLVEKRDYSRSFSAVLLGIFLIAMVGLQLGYAYTNVFAETPITSPETAPEVTPSPTPSDNPITSPEVTPTPSSAPSNGGSNGGNSGGSNNGGGNSNGGSAGAPSCNDAKPGSVPVLLSVRKNGANSVTLVWTKAQSPVTHYAITYGLKSGLQQYGNANVGNVTSYTVNHLSGNATYFFRVRAGNGCNGSNFSNELSTKANGSKVSGPAVGFTPGVLGKNISKATPKPSASPKTQTVKPSPSPVGGLLGFLSHIF